MNASSRKLHTFTSKFDGLAIYFEFFLQLTNFTFCNGSGDKSEGCSGKPGKYIEIVVTVRSRKGKAPTERKDDDDDDYKGNKGKDLPAISLFMSTPAIMSPSTSEPRLGRILGVK